MYPDNPIELFVWVIAAIRDFMDYNIIVGHYCFTLWQVLVCGIGLSTVFWAVSRLLDVDD